MVVQAAPVVVGKSIIAHEETRKISAAIMNETKLPLHEILDEDIASFIRSCVTVASVVILVLEVQADELVHRISYAGKHEILGLVGLGDAQEIPIGRVFFQNAGSGIVGLQFLADGRAARTRKLDEEILKFMTDDHVLMLKPFGKVLPHRSPIPGQEQAPVNWPGRHQICGYVARRKAESIPESPKLPQDRRRIGIACRQRCGIAQRSERGPRDALEVLDLAERKVFLEFAAVLHDIPIIEALDSRRSPVSLQHAIDVLDAQILTDPGQFLGRLCCQAFVEYFQVTMCSSCNPCDLPSVTARRHR